MRRTTSGAASETVPHTMRSEELVWRHFTLRLLRLTVPFPRGRKACVMDHQHRPPPSVTFVWARSDRWRTLPSKNGSDCRSSTGSTSIFPRLPAQRLRAILHRRIGPCVYRGPVTDRNHPQYLPDRGWTWRTGRASCGRSTHVGQLGSYGGPFTCRLPCTGVASKRTVAWCLVVEYSCFT